jgi:hypothetical protein
MLVRISDTFWVDPGDVTCVELVDEAIVLTTKQATRHRFSVHAEHSPNEIAVKLVERINAVGKNGGAR